MRTKIDLNDHTFSFPKIILYACLYLLGVIILGFLTYNESILLSLNELSTPILINLFLYIQTKIYFLALIGILVLLICCVYIYIPFYLMRRKGYENAEITEFFELKKKLQMLKRPLTKVRADVDGEFPTMYLEKQGNLYILEIEKNHWFDKKQIANNQSLFISVFNMQYWKVQEDYETIYLYYSNEEIVMTYREFIQKYCNYSHDFIDDYIYIGYNDGGPVKLKYEDVPHIFIVGTTGSGKSNFIHVLIATLKMIGAKIEGIDGKVKELSHYKNDPHINIETDSKKFVSFIERIYKVMVNRHKYIEEQGKDYYFELELEPIFFILEELTMILGVLSKNKKGKQEESDYHKADRLLTLIGRAGRDAGIYLVGTTQDPLTTNVSSALRGLLNCRILLCPVKEATAFDMMFGHGNRSLPKLKRGYGFVQTDDEVEIFQIPLFPMKQKSTIRPKKKIDI